jgi:aerobic-type carbon monoxide dehydrogenase small subunit (CoxS/CutS family)
MTNLCRCGTYVRVRKAIHAAANDTSGARANKA